MKMETFCIFAAELLIALCLFVIIDIPVQFASAFMFFFLVIGGMIFFEIKQFKKLKKEWKAKPIPICTDEFEDFFYSLKISHQDWYFTNILSKEDRQKLRDWYPVATQQLWADPNLSEKEKMKKSGVYSKHLQTLENLIHFSELAAAPN